MLTLMLMIMLMLMLRFSNGQGVLPVLIYIYLCSYSLENYAKTRSTSGISDGIPTVLNGISEPTDLYGN